MIRHNLFRRKRNGKTDYKKRLILLKSRKPRLVIRKSLNNISVQIIEYSKIGDKVIISAHSNSLKKLGWKSHKGNISAAYLTGLMCGYKAQAKNIKEAVLDSGLAPSVKGSVIYSALKGVIDSKLKVPASETIFPKAEKIEQKGNFKEIKEKIIKSNGS